VLIKNINNTYVSAITEGGTIVLRFSDNQTGRQIIVKDSGLGMDKETCEKLFSGFTRNTTTGTSGEKGTGLGLGIVKKILDAHGYAISVESTIGAGTTFSVSL
jgi:signal transduction histidine kinase